jgi:copper chaperone NosL
MTKTSRIIIGIGAVLLAAVYFVPFWSIYLIAPQYPEGLSMQIWLNKLTGDVEIINGLNHYIGMKHINAEMFPELGYLVYVVAAFILLGLIVAIKPSGKFLLFYILLFASGGVIALIDFYKWGYDYGHNLDPKAAIQVPGLSYQPPLIGHKKLLNFDAFSYPDTGAWIAIAVVATFAIVWLVEWRRSKRAAEQVFRSPVLILSAITAFMFTGCKPGPEKINIGKDLCTECKMTIVDPKFGGEIVTTKGRIFKFDDVHCMAAFLEHRGVELSEIGNTLFVDYEGAHDFISVKDAEFVISSSFNTPMAGNAAAFKGKDAANKKSATIDGSRVTNWSTLYNILVK